MRRSSCGGFEPSFPARFRAVVLPFSDCREQDLEGPIAWGVGSVPDQKSEREVATNAKKLHSFVRSRVRNSADADDIAQETQARVLARSRAGPLKDPLAYAYRVAMNLITDMGRSRAQFPDQPIDDQMASDMLSPLDTLDLKERATLYTQALRAMPTLRRQVFILRQSADLDYPQIAVRLNISVEAAQKHFSRAAADVRRAVAARETAR